MAQEINAKPPDPENVITPDIRAHVKATATRMIGHAALQKDDFKDLCQSMYLEIIKNVPNYDATKSGFYTFACLVIKNWRSDFFTKRIAAGHDVPTVPLGSIQSQYEKMTSENSVDDYMRRLDIRTIVNSLPEIPRQVCLGFMAGLGTREISKKLGISRYYVQRVIIPYLQFRFRKENF